MESALSHFARREAELLRLNEDLEAKKASALANAASAVEAARRPSDRSMVTEQRAPPQPSVEPAPVRAPALSAAAPAPAMLERAPAAQNIADVEELQLAVRKLKAHQQILQAEHERTVEELKARDAELVEERAKRKKAAEEVTALKKSLASSELKSDQLRARAEKAEQSIHALEQDVRELKREGDQLKESQKKLEKESQGKDVKLHRLLEDCERYKASLKDARSGDKDRDHVTRKELERLQLEVKTLVRQRGELLGAFRKQMKLIDVLKRQKVHLEAARLLAFTEEEFMRVLELGEKLSG